MLTSSHSTSLTHLTRGWAGGRGREVWLHPQPMQLRHLFHGRYTSQQACTLLEPGTTTTQTVLCPHPHHHPPPPSPRLESIHCCSRSYYRYAPAKCKTSICHLSARCTMKTSHYATALPGSFTSHGLGAISVPSRSFFLRKKFELPGKWRLWVTATYFKAQGLSFWVL